MQPFDHSDFNLPFDYQSWVNEKLDHIKKDGSYRYFLSLDKSADRFPNFSYSDKSGRPKEAVNWCGNDYLAMSTVSTVREVMKSTITQTGAGSGGTRNIAGTTIHHQALENELSSWHHQDSALLFISAYQANLTAMTTLGRHLPGLVFISDEENHASLIEGMRAVPNKKYIFKHNDVQHLEDILQSIPLSVPKLIVFESVYSISGTLAPIEQILSLSKKYHALNYIDEVHAVGLYGPHGAGIVEQLGLESQIDFINGTLSKAIGVFGGYLAGSKHWMDFFRSFAPGFIFTTSLPPAICAAATTSIQYIRGNDSIRNQFFKNVELLRSILDQKQILYTGLSSHITNISIGSSELCKSVSDRLLNDFGIYIQPINFPTVPQGQACLRITITPRHSKEHIKQLVDALNTIINSNLVITGRSSKLSRVQVELVKQKLEKHHLKIESRYKESLGDQLADVPLHTQEGVDFFTQTLFDDLDQGQADIAVHSLKDMSTAHFLGEHQFAIVDRDETRDIAIFNSNIIERLKNGLPIRIGTCSFRRETMATEFLSKALPHVGKPFQIITLPIRGNVDTRLKKLDQGEYDGIILAAAGINRLLKSQSVNEIRGLLQDKKIMVLPLIECVPAPAQGAIVAEASTINERACQLLKKINDPELYTDCSQEKKIALRYGAGCIQRFGVTTLSSGSTKWQYAAGVDEGGNSFEEWYGLNLPEFNLDPHAIINSDQLGFTANRNYFQFPSIPKQTKLLFIAHSAALNSGFDLSHLSSYRVWTAGTSSWYKLAQQGIWVEGCADSMGLQSIQSLLCIPLIDIQKEEICILTNLNSAQRWANDGWQAAATYDIRFESSLIDKYKLRSAQFIFWNCYAHLETIEEIIPDNILHACLPGRTAELLKLKGITPILFPTLAAFKQWKTKYSRSHYAA